MTWAPCPHGVRTRGKKSTGNRAFCGCEQLQRFTPLDWSDIEQWVQAEHNAFFMCDKFEKSQWVELLPAEGPDSDAFDEELHHEYSKCRASPETPGGCLGICLQETSLALGTAHKQTPLAQTIIANSLPHMEIDDSSMLSTPPEKEPVMECSLMLTTLSGETFQVSLSVAKFDRFEDLEDQVMDYLVSVTDLKVFGCSIDFLQTATQTYPEDPIWDKLQQDMAYTIVFRN